MPPPKKTGSQLDSFTSAFLRCVPSGNRYSKSKKSVLPLSQRCFCKNRRLPFPTLHRNFTVTWICKSLITGAVRHISRMFKEKCTTFSWNNGRKQCLSCKETIVTIVERLYFTTKGGQQTTQRNERTSQTTRILCEATIFIVKPVDTEIVRPINVRSSSTAQVIRYNTPAKP